MKKLLFILLIGPAMVIGQVERPHKKPANGDPSQITADRMSIGGFVQMDNEHAPLLCSIYVKNVKFNIGNTKIYCDSAVSTKNYAYFYDVKIRNPKHSLKGSCFVYNKQTKTGIIKGSVLNSSGALIATNAELDFSNSDDFSITKFMDDSTAKMSKPKFYEKQILTNTLQLTGKDASKHLSKTDYENMDKLISKIENDSSFHAVRCYHVTVTDRSNAGEVVGETSNHLKGKGWTQQGSSGLISGDSIIGITFQLNKQDHCFYVLIGDL